MKLHKIIGIASKGMTGINVVKVVGIVAQIVGFGSTLSLNWVQDKEIDEKIAKAVAEALADQRK